MLPKKDVKQGIAVGIKTRILFVSSLNLIVSGPLGMKDLVLKLVAQE